MTPEAVVKQVRNIAGDVSANQFSDDVLTDWINAGIREIVIENGLLQKTASTNTVIGTYEYDVPTDIFKLHSISVDKEVLQLRNLQGSQAVLDDAPVGSQQGRPQYAYVWAGKITLFPTPDAVYTLKIYYTNMPVSITYDSETDPKWTPNTISIPESYHNRLVTYCLAQVALQDDDHNKYQVLMQEFATGVVSTKHQGQSEDDLYPFISVSNRDMGDGYDLVDVQW